MAHGAVCALLIALLGCSFAGAAAPLAPFGAKKGGVEVSSTVATFYNSDLSLKSTCKFSIDKARQFHGHAIQFVITHYWVAEPRIKNILDPKYKVKYFCYKETSKSKCLPFNPKAISRFSAGLTSCMAYAVRQGFTKILITPHVDDNNGQVFNWRNNLRFQPSQKYSKWSYYDVMLKPIAVAINNVVKYHKNFEPLLTLQGEMGACIFTRPAAFRRLIAPVKGLVKSKKFKVGLGLNWNTIKGTSVKVKDVDAKEARKLFYAADFVSISSYAPMPVFPKIIHMETAFRLVEFELAPFGFSLKGLQKAGKKLYISEWGVGGAKRDGVTLAKSVADVAKQPFYGLFKEFDPKNNPFPKGSARKAFLVRYFKTTLQWLGKGGGPYYKTSALFLWNLNSYDVQGIAPFTYKYKRGYKGPGYIQPDISAMIKSYNKYVNS